jgi:2-phospho-L-lactate guanylyltransferase
MTRWTAIVPLKTVGERKSRLAGLLSAADRHSLSERMFAHVIAVLSGHPAIGSVVLLSALLPDDWAGFWIADEGRGLNAELEAARAQLAESPLLVLHGDLPLLAPSDIDDFLGAATRAGIAIAPDRAGRGTNALAVMPGHAISFRFGPDSCRLHLAQAPMAAVINRQGLACDIDTPEDLATAEEAGFRLAN